MLPKCRIFEARFTTQIPNLLQGQQLHSGVDKNCKRKCVLIFFCCRPLKFLLLKSNTKHMFLKNSRFKPHHHTAKAPSSPEHILKVFKQYRRIFFGRGGGLLKLLNQKTKKRQNFVILLDLKNFY